ncbi:MAG: DEAD/DEAH box helicase [Devosia sp.]
MNRDLRPHQIKAIEMLRAALSSGKRRPILQMPTGAGKTLTATAIVEGARRKGNRVVFTVPAIELVDQTVEAFGAEGIEQIGVIQADHILTDWMKPVQIASVQTLALRKEMPAAGIVIVDEAHRSYRAIARWMAERPDLIFIGLTATPWARGMAKHWDALLIPTSTQALIDEGYLSPFRVFGPSEPDLSKVSTVAGDYHEGELSDVMSESTLTADVVATWLQLGENRPTLCFAVDRAHARKLTDEFQRAGVATAYVDGYTEKPERENIRRWFHDGRVKVVVNVGVLTTGIDWDCRCLILARPTKSEMLYVQIIGRALRTADGKSDALILDHTGTTTRLGFVTDIRHDLLDDGRPRKGGGSRDEAAPLPVKCSSCSHLKPAGVHKCPSCGFAPERQSAVETRQGSLVQMKGKKREPSRQEKQRFYSGLLWFVERNGYRAGWAANNFRKKFGVWPRGMHEISAPPSADCSGWVTAQRIAFSKARKAEERNAA